MDQFWSYSYNYIISALTLVVLSTIWYLKYFQLLPQFRPRGHQNATSLTVLSSAVANKGSFADRCNTVLYFGPGLKNEESQDEFFNYFRSAELSIQLCLFRFSCHKLRQIIQEKHDAGLIVNIIIDEDVYQDTKSRGTVIPELTKQKIKVRTLAAPKGMMHHKFAIVDGEVIMTGSLNWTNQAFYDNFEDVLVSTNPAHVSKYQTRFHQLWVESEQRC